MVKKIKNLIQNYGIGGIGKSLHIAISQSFIAALFILTDYIFSKELSVAEFGTWKETFFFLNLGIPLLAFGLPEGYKYFIAKEKNVSHYFSNLLLALLIITIAIETVLGVVHLFHWMSVIDLGVYYGYSLLLPLPLLAFLLNKTLRYSYINLDQTERLTKLSIYGSMGSLALIILGMILVSSNKEYIVLAAILIYFSIFFLPSIFYLSRFSDFSFSFGLDRSSLKKMLVYGLPLYLATFAGLLSNYLDKLIVNIATDDSTFAIFAVGAFEIPLFAMLSAAFSQQIFPRMVRLIGENREEEAKRVWIEATKKVSLITYPIILVAMFFAEEIIYWVYSESYATSVILFKTYLLVGLFRNNSYGILLTAKGETKIITKIALAVLTLNLISSITLFYFYGLTGVVFGSLVSTFAFTSYVLFKEQMIASYVKNVVLSKVIGPLIGLILIIYFLFQ